MRPLLGQIVFIVGFLGAVTSGVVAYRQSGPYGERDRHDPRVRRVVDPRTGRLTLLIYDSDADGRFDTWAFMDGDRLLRMETDANEDGVIDRWQYYDDTGKLTRIGTSSRHNGIADVWEVPESDAADESAGPQ